MSDYGDFLHAVNVEADAMAIAFAGNRQDLGKLLRICYLAGCGGRDAVDLLMALFPPPRVQSHPLPELIGQIWADHQAREKEINRQLGREG